MQQPQDARAALAEDFAILHAASRQQPMPDLATRRQQIKALAALLLQHQSALADAVSADFGYRSTTETRLAEIFPVLQSIRHARRHLARWMRPERRSLACWFWPAKNRLIPQPLGVVGIVVPWNYPIFLALGPLVSALAAGNRALLKMSELSPHTGALLARLLPEALGDDVVRVINGPVSLAQQFVSLPFDHLLFTGSTAVGHQVMAAAAHNLTPVTLELGGKSPVLIAPDANLQQAAQAIVAGKMLNAGQTCVAPDYVLLPAGQRQALVDALVAAATRAYPTLVDNPDLTAIVNDAHYQRLQVWRQQALAGGAECCQVNPANEALSASRKLPLTLFWQLPADCLLLQQEIFGPYLPLLEYHSLDEAIDWINQRPRPLALYLFSRERVLIERVLSQTVAGGVAINETVLQVAQDDLPFGGVGASGMGHYHAREGFMTFSKLKPVFYQSRFNLRWMLLPPYGRLSAWLLSWMVR